MTATYTLIKCSKDDAKTFEKILDIFTENNEVDLNKAMPMPELLENTMHELSLEYLLSYIYYNRSERCSELPEVFNNYTPNRTKEYLDKMIRTISATTRRCLSDISVEECLDNSFEAYKQYGCIDWYEWRKKNWGSVDNACNTSINHTNHSVLFETENKYPAKLLTNVIKRNKLSCVVLCSKPERFREAIVMWFENGRLIPGLSFDPKKDAPPLDYEDIGRYAKYNNKEICCSLIHAMIQPKDWVFSNKLWCMSMEGHLADTHKTIRYPITDVLYKRDKYSIRFYDLLSILGEVYVY